MADCVLLSAGTSYQDPHVEVFKLSVAPLYLAVAAVAAALAVRYFVMANASAGSARLSQIAFHCIVCVACMTRAAVLPVRCASHNIRYSIDRSFSILYCHCSCSFGVIIRNN
jgi:hypothetical protein